MDICPSRDDAQPHIFRDGKCVLCYRTQTPPCEKCGDGPTQDCGSIGDPHYYCWACRTYPNRKV